MNSKLLISLVVFLVISFPSVAQIMEISGRIVDSKTGTGIGGAFIENSVKDKLVQSDPNGYFNIEVDQDIQELTISADHYFSVQYNIQDKPYIRLIRKINSENFRAGYEVTDFKNATTTLYQVNSQNLNQGFLPSPDHLIQGRVAGVQVLSSSGEPGSSSQINIRGYTSFILTNNPLIIVDGMILSEFDISPGSNDLGLGSSPPANPLNFLNPDIIESVEILRDIAATSIYGARGANGVVLITTKSGEKAKKRLEFNTAFGISNQPNRYNLLNAEEFLGALGEDMDVLNFGHDTDWQAEVSSQRISSAYNLGFSDSYENGHYRISLGLENQEGVLKNSSLDRKDVSLNLNHKFIDDRLNLNFTLIGSFVGSQNPLISTNSDGLLGNVYRANPTRPPDPDSPFPFTDSYNPLSLLENTADESSTKRGMSYLSLSYDINENFKFSVNTGFDLTHAQRNQAFTSDLNLGTLNQGGRGHNQNWNSSSYLLEMLVDYEKVFDEHKINILGGFGYQNFNQKTRDLRGLGFQNGQDLNLIISDLNASGEIVRESIFGSYQQWGLDSDKLFINRLLTNPNSEIRTNDFSELNVLSIMEIQNQTFNEIQSFFGRINYSFLNKYMFAASLRADGSTRFAPNNKYGIFPAVSIGWLISEEEYFPKAISFFKIRGGMGVAGNQALPHNAYTSSVKFSSDFFNFNGLWQVPGAFNVGIDNPDLRWEQTEEITYGVDFGIFKNRIFGTINFYNRRTIDMIGILMDPFLGSGYLNLDSELINTGFELNLDMVLLSSKNFQWTAGINFAQNENKVTELSQTYDYGFLYRLNTPSNFSQRVAEGQPLFSYFLHDFAGFDVDGISEYNNGDFAQLIGKSPIPKNIFGFYSEWFYKNLDLSVMFYGQSGHYLYNNTENSYFVANALANGYNVTESVLVSEESPNNSPDPSSRFLQKGDFLRLQNLILGYNFKFQQPKTIKSLRVSFIGQNLLTLTNYGGIDPEFYQNSSINANRTIGIDYLTYPRPRVYSFSLNLVL